MGNALHQRLSESERKLRRGGSRRGRVRAFNSELRKSSRVGVFASRAFNLQWREQLNRSAFVEPRARQVKR